MKRLLKSGSKTQMIEHFLPALKDAAMFAD
jgi:hypothetical protein